MVTLNFLCVTVQNVLMFALEMLCSGFILPDSKKDNFGMFIKVTPGIFSYSSPLQTMVL
jgi:hypothetical protein